MRLVFTVRLLEAAEWLYLRTHGWQHDGIDWQPPADYPFRHHRSYTRGHAVNAQKQITYNSIRNERVRKRV